RADRPDDARSGPRHQGRPGRPPARDEPVCLHPGSPPERPGAGAGERAGATPAGCLRPPSGPAGRVRPLRAGLAGVTVRRGEVRWYRFARPDKRRPVLVLTRGSALEFLDEATIAPITTTVRGSPSEVAIGPQDGMPRECAV